MGFKCGIVGLPNVGKSTLYNALTNGSIAAENYPFCTIEPNVGVVPVTDPRLDAIAEIAKSAKVVPTTMEFVDIAGLVAGASKGEGLGNKFLAHIRETHAIAHVVRCFHSDDVIHVADKVDPADDIATIDTELLLADIDTTDRSKDRAVKVARSGDKAALATVKLMERVAAHLADSKPARSLDVDDEERSILGQLNLITAKPAMYIANVDEGGFENNPLLDRVREIAAADAAIVVPVSAAIEAELAQIDGEDRAEFLADLGLDKSGLERMIFAGYELLGLQTFFTAGPKEARAWTVRHGSTAPNAAGVIHTDFEKGFIRAEVIAYEDFIAHKGEAGAKEAGKWRLEGKDYMMVEGDVVHFRFNV